MMSNLCRKILKYLGMYSWLCKCKGNLVSIQILFYHNIPIKTSISLFIILYYYIFKCIKYIIYIYLDLQY